MSDKAVLYPTETYKFQGITYVPHYKNGSIFVGPGYPIHNVRRYSAAELIAAGAVKNIDMLWSRSMHGKVDNLNP